MGILDDLLGSVAGQAAGGRQQPVQAGVGGGMGKALVALLPIVLAMLASRGRGAPQAGFGPGMDTGGGGLDDLLGQVLGGGAATRAGAGSMGGGLGDLLGQVLGGGAAAGGLGGLLEQLQRAGYGEQAGSWVGRGQNLPLPPDALEKIFGRGGLEQIAGQAGISPEEASRGLSELLPEVVDRVTPNGEVPDFDSLTSSVQDLARQMGFR